MQDTIESNIKDKDLIDTRRREIVNAAVELFVRKGFHQTIILEQRKIYFF